MDKRQAAVMNLEKPYYSIYEAAEILGVHHNTIRNRIKDGRLQAGRVGWDWRISKGALLDFMAPQNAPKTE